MKLPSSARFITSVLVVVIIACGMVYASWLFTSLPPNPGGQIPGWAFSTRLANISSVSCPSRSFIKGFDSSYRPVCVPYNAPTASVSISVTPATGTYPAGPLGTEMPGGKFGTYFKNIIDICPGNGVVQKFTSQGKKICVDTLNRSSLTSNPADGSYTIAPKPATPAGENSGGKFQSYFTNMFASACGTSQGITAFNASGTPACANIPVDGVCGSSNGGVYYSEPSTGLCNAWNTSAIVGGGPWSWSCIGLDLGTTATCSAIKRVDGGWSAWSGWGACSAACGWGTQGRTRTCTNPAPENGGADCVGSTTESQSCNTHGCPVNCAGYWSDNGTCSASCGGGAVQQTYIVTTPAANGGAACPYPNGATQWGGTSCNTHGCPVNCAGYWSDNGTCSASCGGGVVQQTYTVTTPAMNGGAACSAANGATQWGGASCNTQPCYVRMSWAARHNMSCASITVNGTYIGDINCGPWDSVNHTCKTDFIAQSMWFTHGIIVSESGQWHIPVEASCGGGYGTYFTIDLY